MIRRNDDDLKILLEAEADVDKVKRWIVEIYYGRDPLNFHLTGDVFDWWVEEVLQNYQKAKNQKIRKLILHKVLHTKEVVEAGLDIVVRTGEIDWDPFVVCTVCLLHDIGRFPQALLGSYSDKETNFDHAKEGAKMIDNKNLPEMEMMGIDKNLVVEAVEAHSAISYTGNNIYPKLTRDSDKLALLRYMPYLMDDERFPKIKVNEKALAAYKEGRMVEHKDMLSRADVCLAWLCWQNDFNFEATRMAFLEEGIKDWVKSELYKEGVEI
ncbi:MAG TPA: HD domain-containing protein [Patescibacteria group bacterium]